MAEIVKTPIATKLTLTKEAIDAGNVIVPQGYELVKKPDPNQTILDEIARVEAQLEGMSKPTDEELLAWAKDCHPYYVYNRELEIYRNMV